MTCTNCTQMCMSKLRYMYHVYSSFNVFSISCTCNYYISYVDISFLSQGGRSPLWTASYVGHLDVVNTLIDAGADVNQANAVNSNNLIIFCVDLDIHVGSKCKIIIRLNCYSVLASVLAPSSFYSYFTMYVSIIKC